jgi:cell division FtsZ-interacting protein ZapD
MDDVMCKSSIKLVLLKGLGKSFQFVQSVFSLLSVLRLQRVNTDLLKSDNKLTRGYKQYKTLDNTGNSMIELGEIRMPVMGSNVTMVTEPS